MTDVVRILRAIFFSIGPACDLACVQIAWSRSDFCGPWQSQCFPQNFTRRGQTELSSCAAYEREREKAFENS